jgi:hypothetical protein
LISTAKRIPPGSAPAAIEVHRAGAEIFTLINVFSVAPDHQQELANCQ